MTWGSTIPTPPTPNKSPGWWVLYNISPTGIVSGEAFGTPSAAPVQHIFATAIASSEAFGSIALKFPQFLSPTGIASGEAFGGSVTHPGTVTIGAQAIASAEAFGNPVITAGGALILVAGIAPGSMGNPTITTGVINISCTGIASLETFGSAGLVQLINSLTGIISQEAFGSQKLSYIIAPSGIATSEIFGSTVVAGPMQPIGPTGIASTEAFGGSTASPGTAFVLPSGIISSEAFGTSVVTTGSVNISCTGIASTETFGTAKLTSVIAPTGISSAESIGSATVANSGFTTIFTDLFNRADSGNGSIDNSTNWVDNANWQISSNTLKDIEQDGFHVSVATPNIKVTPSYQAIEFVVGSIGTGATTLNGGEQAYFADFRYVQELDDYISFGIQIDLGSGLYSIFAQSADASIVYPGSSFFALANSDIIKLEMRETSGVATYTAYKNGISQDSYAETTNYGSSLSHDALRYEQFSVVLPPNYNLQSTIDSFKVFGVISTYVHPQIIAPSGIDSAEAFGTPTIAWPTTISLGTVGAVGSAGTTTTAGTASVTPATPASLANGDRVFVFTAESNPTMGSTPSGWTALYTNVQLGTGSAAASSGSRYLSCYYRDKDGSWSTVPAFTLSSATQNSHAAVAIRVTKPSGVFSTPTFTTAGSDFGTPNTSHSATTGSLARNAGGLLMIHTGTNDNVTFSAEAISGFTVTEQADGGTATGNDVALNVCTAPVAASATGALTFTATLSAASEGGTVIVEQAGMNA